MDGRPYSVWEAPNARFLEGGNGDATVSALRQLVADRHRVGASRSAPPVEDADQIRRFAALRDDGILTEDEFQAKKRAILGL
jgi:hypothetical protein